MLKTLPNGRPAPTSSLEHPSVLFADAPHEFAPFFSPRQGHNGGKTEQLCDI
jgi:hypothetical protein